MKKSQQQATLFQSWSQKKKDGNKEPSKNVGKGKDLYYYCFVF